MITQQNIDTLLGNGGNVLGSDGEKIGSIGQVYLDDQTGEPSWVTAKTGLFGTSESFVPLQGADVSGHDVRVPYTKSQVKDAPRVDSDGSLSPEEEDRLYRHYEIGGGTSGYTETTTTTGTVGQSDRDLDLDTSGRQADLGTNSHGTVGHDTSGPTTDNAMTRSEEQLRVGVERREAGKARMRKYVVTENVTQTVPVTREEVRVEREPITDANRGDAYDGPAISEEEHEVTLHAERAVVEKEAVPVERVRLDTETVTSQETVSADVRKEKIEVEGVDETRRDNNL
jgi:uncharacterized protein (TIGR02271 family)